MNRMPGSPAPLVEQCTGKSVIENGVSAQEVAADSRRMGRNDLRAAPLKQLKLAA